MTVDAISSLRPNLWQKTAKHFGKGHKCSGFRTKSVRELEQPTSFCPRNPEEKVWVHTVDTRVRKLYRCQIIIVRKKLSDPLSAARFWVTSDLDADAQICINVISIRWEIEIFFEDMKGLLGIDQYQIMTSTGLLRYWTLCWIAFSFLEEIRHDLKQNNDNKEPIGEKIGIVQECETDLDECQKTYHATLGQARRKVQETHQELFLEWVYHHALSGTPVKELHTLLIA